MAMRTGRLRKELADLEKESPEGIQIVTKSTADAGKFSASALRSVAKLLLFATHDDFSCAGISGPEGTAYTGGNFVLEIVCGPAYPLRPPSVRFRTPVYHPNVARGDGAICLDMLKPAPAGTWSAARCGVRVMLLSIRELLRTPNTKDPLETAIVSSLCPLPSPCPHCLWCRHSSWTMTLMRFTNQQCSTHKAMPGQRPDRLRTCRQGQGQLLLRQRHRLGRWDGLQLEARSDSGTAPPMKHERMDCSNEW